MVGLTVSSLHWIAVSFDMDHSFCSGGALASLGWLRFEEARPGALPGRAAKMVFLFGHLL
jgi:hypothetical protein